MDNKASCIYLCYFLPLTRINSLLVLLFFLCLMNPHFKAEEIDE